MHKKTSSDGGSITTFGACLYIRVSAFVDDAVPNITYILPDLSRLLRHHTYLYRSTIQDPVFSRWSPRWLQRMLADQRPFETARAVERRMESSALDS